MNVKSKLKGFILVIVGGLYILNLTAGFIEFIPDNLPLIGNLDEGGAGALILQGLKIIFKRK